jgi:hypothetical protein
MANVHRNDTWHPCSATTAAAAQTVWRDSQDGRTAYSPAIDALAASYIPSTTAAATVAAAGRAYSPTLSTRSYFPDSPRAASSSTHNGGSSNGNAVQQQQQQQQQQQRCACVCAVPVWAGSSVVGVLQVVELGGPGSVTSDHDLACTVMVRHR